MSRIINLSDEQLEFLELARMKSFNEKTIVFVDAVVALTWDGKGIKLFGFTVSDKHNIASCVATYNRGTPQ